VIDVGYHRHEILEATRTQVEHGHYASSKIYGDGSAGERIAELLGRVPLEIEKRLMY
jgi:hypothetical protein